MLRRIFGPKKDYVNWHLRILRDEDIQGFHTSPVVLRTVTSEMLQWDRGRQEMHTEF